MLVAPNSSAGVVLSQPPISTTPSRGWPRNNSSASIANRLRYSMVVGFRNDSDSDSAGSSMGKPPALSTPRLTSSTRDLKCMWQGCASDQVLRIAITGRPAHSSGAYPICIARERWPNALRSSGANQRALRSDSGLFLLFVIWHLLRRLTLNAVERSAVAHDAKNPLSRADTGKPDFAPRVH